jgi:FtsZ-binding cell division protein ZapB
MAENLSKARNELKGMRDAIRQATRKWHTYAEPYEKAGQWKTIQNVQSHIQKLKEKYPALRDDRDSADDWRPGGRAL